MSANRVRIVGGVHRSRVLRFPHRATLRPTPDRVRETLFNWLGQDLSGCECLDLFAGSGALGFEAVSRGARRVVMVENDPVTWRALERNAVELGCLPIVELHRADALEFAGTVGEAFDIVFLDPPFDSGVLAHLAAALPRLTRRGSMVYVESGRGVAFDGGVFRLYRQGRAGQVTYQLFSHGDQ
ncbi:MAG: 16S rRNA (guanine(966)-N(2))-methyltransferase RsmD [Burkholderiales bacterium]|nr:16S rRNA (guanine(966)-N(2))-methyltransferase RsmD [Burkholderiales bacterium]